MCGYEVYVIDMLGSGEDIMFFGEVMFERYVDVICKVIVFIGKCVMLVGYSLGGIVVVVVVEKNVQDVVCIIYLGGYVLSDGEFIDLFLDVVFDKDVVILGM